jgi:hypothetical protein
VNALAKFYDVDRFRVHRVDEVLQPVTEAGVVDFGRAQHDYP